MTSTESGGKIIIQKNEEQDSLQSNQFNVFSLYHDFKRIIFVEITQSVSCGWAGKKM